MGGGRKTRVKFISFILASNLALSCAFFSCANASGGSENGNNLQTPTSGNATQTLSSARWSCATSEEETALGNTVSEVLCLFDDNKFELRKNISYKNISFFQTFYKGTYTGGIRNGMTFDIEEELDTEDFDEDMNQVFNSETAETQSTQQASNATSRSAMPTARVASRNIAEILSDCQAKLKNAKFKKVANKNMSLKTNDSSIELTNADGKKETVEEKTVGGCINLDGFLLTGNPCNMRPDKTKNIFEWASTEVAGAKVLTKTADGKWTCQFRADSDDTLIRIIWNEWAADWGLSAIDKEKSKSTLPSGVGITDDTQAVNNTADNKKYQDPRNIAITGLEAKRKYDITFDTKKSPGKICIELKEHKISTLDGWLFSGTACEMEVSKYEHGGKWPINTADGALPLKKTGSNSWTITVTTKPGWNGFKLCTQNWLDEIAWSGFDWKSSWDEYNGLRGSNVENYSLEDDDTIAFCDHFEGTEKITLTFGINNGRVACKTDISYTTEFDFDIYNEYAILESEPVAENEWASLANGEIGSDKKFAFSISKESGILLIHYPTKRDENTTWYQDINYQRLESVELPSGANWSITYDIYGILLTGLVPDKTYNVPSKSDT